MPKVLPNINKTILTIAEKHFKERGFEGADMREIASEADIAVGTIYLHYHNKEQLYRHVVENRWNNAVRKMNAISQEDGLPVEIFRQTLLELVSFMAERKSIHNLWMEIGMIHHQAAVGSEIAGMKAGAHNPVVSILASELSQIYGKDITEKIHVILEQIANMTFIMAVDTSLRESEDNEKRIDLIVDMVTKYVSGIVLK